MRPGRGIVGSRDGEERSPAMAMAVGPMHAEYGREDTRGAGGDAADAGVADAGVAASDGRELEDSRATHMEGDVSLNL